MANPKNTNKYPRRAKPLGWNSSDEDEIERRRKRAVSESFDINPAANSGSIFSDWFITGASRETYRVEIRSLNSAINSCGCKDYQVNGLGTCKHVEAVLMLAQQRKYRHELEGGHPNVEIFLDRRDENITVSFPKRMRKTARLYQLVNGYFDANNRLRGDPLQSMATLQNRLVNESSRIRGQVRISTHLNDWLDQVQSAANRRKSRNTFEEDLKRGRVSLAEVKLPLYPYQQEGMLHLAFTGRALLADEMGLGKTVQAIAGSELLNRLHSISKVLVISPASLKSEWREQIAKFSDREALIIQGIRKRRHRLYQQSAFFFLANYEQILYDKDYINNEMQPDLIILDEAQRIKNWQTKTATAIKQLNSPYAFVLTGTPLENRIDEIYSITQFLDPSLLGPLFRFNREFHELDEKGQAIGYKNLDRLHKRLQPVMLRRRKEDVEGELPLRSDNNYFVKMTPVQQDQYAEHKATVDRLAHLAKRRPLLKKERDRLMRALGCMRMVCDTPFILDQKTRVSPKLDELEKLLDDLFSDPACKIIIFSEWARMLSLLVERLQQTGIGYALHTGSVTQNKRRKEINRFINDPDCRLFLATDSAATGLNLQVARVVINLDLPWNPAKLEQRIARAWRKHQLHPVSVVNLVSEFTIEHRMLDVLRHKTTLADEVIDGAGRLTEMKISAGQSFMEQLDELIAESAPRRPPLDRFIAQVVAEPEGAPERLEQRGETILAVADEALQDRLQERLTEHFGETPPQLKILDRNLYATLQQLVEAGIIQFTHVTTGRVYDASVDADNETRVRQRREAKVKKALGAAEKKYRMSQLLADGGFPAESLAPLSDALNQALAAGAAASDLTIDEPIAIGQLGPLQKSYDLPADTLSTLATLRHERGSLDELGTRNIMTAAGEIFAAIKTAMALNSCA